MTLRIGLVGLGGIAQKVYLPLLCQSDHWQVVGAFSPNQLKARVLCDSYRISCYSTLSALAADCDAVFVHTSTDSHFAVVGQLLALGVHVYVDKPLASTLEHAQQLVELAVRKRRFLMVGFNRRFAPLYLRLKQNLDQAASLRIDKHRADSIGPQDVRFTLLDDYLHVVDTALWLTDGALTGAGAAVPCQGTTLKGGVLQKNPSGQMLYAEHYFTQRGCAITTSMHRQAGSQCETVSAVTSGAVYRIEEMRLWRSESQGVISELPVPAWQTILTQRGFTGAVEHFIASVANQTPPCVSGEQALLAQSWVEHILAG
ncbi:Gfo/Idh/MocA family oxidoreductase [Acerihabitans sp. TG2]|uniref:Gfo/Idh/MocA family protein n=1 Tax=Acerihabitans sp. TG2 TaxID=3096008 RepID=UPI002B238451|nr:Gfo/Idh/MocA family oxidoreductase [Acerihabitans sp. TG2]MEA9392953.1 Gfo/Idh/MocA family oxidoreductase [Acerihabitans sp. TG2]